MKPEINNRYQRKIFTIPNILTFFRLALIPIFIWLYSFKKEYTFSTAVLVVSALTDIVDGFIARRFNMISDVGKALDPIADKLTQLSVLICLLFRFPLMLISALLLVIKEVFSGIMGIINIKRNHRVPSAVWHGKVTTSLLYGTMILHVVWWSIPTAVSHTTIVICVIMMLTSAILYGIMHFKAIKKIK